MNNMSLEQENAELREQIAALIIDRDTFKSMLEDAEGRVLRLTVEMKKYKAFWEQSRLADRQAFEISERRNKC